MNDKGRSEDLKHALALVDNVQNDPSHVLKAATKLLLRDELHPESQVIAYWAQGLAHRQLNQLNLAEKQFGTGLRLATKNGYRKRAAQIRSSLAIVYFYRGDTQGAFEQAELASRDLFGGDLSRNEMQTALILQRMGRMEEALESYRKALAGLREAGDRLAEARLLVNRGILHGYRGELDQGTADLSHAAAIGDELDQSLIVAACAHNLGFLEGRRGDIPTALRWFDRAEFAYNDLGRPPGMVEVLDANRAELLLSVGLIDEADEAVRSAIVGLEKSDNKTDLSEARLLSAEVALADDRPDDARALATTARDEFIEQDRLAWSLLASYVTSQALAQTSEGDVDSAALTADLADQLDQAGLSLEAQHCRLLAGRIALEAGNRKESRRLLSQASGAKRRGPAVGRAQAWYAEALLRDAEGNSYGTSRAIDAGLRVIRDYRSSLGTSEMRSHAAVHGRDLAILATRNAMRSGSAWQVLKAVEAWRSISSQVASVRPPTDPEMQHLLSELRRVDAEMREAGLAGQRTDLLMTDKTRLESAIRSAGRRMHGEALNSRTSLLDRDQVISKLADRQLISYFELDGTLHAVSVAQGRAAIQELGKADAVRKQVDSLIFALSRLAIGAGSPRSLKTAESTMDDSLSALRVLIMEPLLNGADRVTVVPSGALHRLPWPALTQSTTVSASPSLETWMKAISGQRIITETSIAALIAGPELPGAVNEISMLSTIYQHQRRLTGQDATADETIKAIDGSDVAHIAAHGNFRYDNPAFSALILDDGPLTVYDLERIEHPPSAVVLSSCDTGISKVVAGDELLGLSSALINMGVANLIAPVVPISDELAVELMVAIHTQIAAGKSPSAALSESVAEDPGASAQYRALHHSFVSMGA